MSVYGQLKDWQKIPHARREWKAYRDRLTAFITAHTESGATAAVLGAGECNDLDLGVLCGHFRKVYLLDLEESVMREACARCHAPQEKTVLLARDFLGVSQMDYEDYAQTLQLGIRLRGKNTDIRELAGLARRKLDSIYEKAFARPLALLDGECDYVIAAGVHSQINAMAPMIWNAYEQALGQREPQMYLYFAEKNNEAVRRFDEAALSAARRGALYAYEQKRLGIEGSVQGAVQGMENMARFIKEGKLRETGREQLLWNFDVAQAIAYEMLLVACETDRKL